MMDGLQRSRLITTVVLDVCIRRGVEEEFVTRYSSYPDVKKLVNHWHLLDRDHKKQLLNNSLVHLVFLKGTKEGGSGLFWENTET